MPTLWSLARPAVALVAALAGTVISTAPAEAMIVEPDVPVTAERAAATVHPAVVRVTGTFVGRVHDGKGGYANGGQPYTVTLKCSGFGVHPDGYIATVGHCIDANDMTVRGVFIRAAAEEAVERSPDVPLDEMISYGEAAWVVEGETPGSPVMSMISVTGIAGTPSDGLLARVVDDRPVGQGDVGLLKVDTTAMPSLELATGSSLAVGTRLLVAGYPLSMGGSIATGATPMFREGAVDGSTTDGGRPVYRTDVAPEVGMSGGPVVDDSGRVLGVASVRETAAQQPFTFAAPVSGFADLLGRNGVRAELGPRDLRYRDALDAYFRGEYTDAMETIDRLQQEGPTHPRIGRLRTDAESARELHGDASENRTTQILVWGSVGAGLLVILVTGILLVVRGRRRHAAMPVPPPLPGPYGGPAGPVPARMWQPEPPPRAPRRPYGPVHQRPPVAPHGRPPQPPAHFDGPTRAITVPRPAPQGSNEPEDRTVTITPPPSATTAVEGAGPAGADQDQSRPVVE